MTTPTSEADQVEKLPVGVLAYVGDAVYELYVRVRLVQGGLRDLDELHREAVMRVSAKAQAHTLAQLDSFLRSDELDVARRARNARTGRGPRNAAVLDYRHSTGFEAVLGYLYLKGREERLREVIEKALTIADAPPGGPGQ